MKKNNRIWIYSLMIMGVFLMLSSNCKKDDDNNNNPPSNTITDIDGNVYHTVTIGTQVWMVENLRTTRYRNSEPIPNVTNGTAWGNLTTGAYCDYDNTPGNSTTYGKLYNFYTVVDSRNLCPTGWHVPTNSEYQTLIDYLGGSTIAGGKMKEAGTTHWQDPNTDATNESGFTGLPGGFRYRGSDDNFSWIGSYGYWWSASEVDSTFAWHRYLRYNSAEVNLYDYCYHKSYGFSVRCMKD
jgi:uncharacterized protein (TIGR02145 family)